MSLFKQLSLCGLLAITLNATAGQVEADNILMMDDATMDSIEGSSFSKSSIELFSNNFESSMQSRFQRDGLDYKRYMTLKQRSGKGIIGLSHEDSALLARGQKYEILRDAFNYVKTNMVRSSREESLLYATAQLANTVWRMGYYSKDKEVKRITDGFITTCIGCR